MTPETKRTVKATLTRGLLRHCKRCGSPKFNLYRRLWPRRDVVRCEDCGVRQ